MIKNYLKIAWRNIRRNKAFSITNLSGLTIGMTCTILILLWVQDELNYDKFHSNHSQVYHVLVNRNFNGETTTDISSPFPLSAALKSNFPEIKSSTVGDFGGEHVLKHGETMLKRRGYFVSPTYFEVFQWDFIRGNEAGALSSPGSIVITQSTAKAFFGTDDVVGKIIRTDNETDRAVTAVVKDPPSNSSIQFGFIAPFDYSGGFIKEATSDWVNCFTQSFVEVQPGTDINKLNAKISAFANERGEKQNFGYFLHPMDKWRLYSDFKNGKNTGGMIAYVKLFSVIAIIILIIACVNFMNLSTAKSEKRAREVGIRKTLGSARRQLVIQFYSESLIFSVLAFLFSVGFVFLLLPSFNQMIGKQLTLNVGDPLFLVMSVGMIAFTGLIAGSYPAIYLSSFNAIKVLKGNFLPGKSAALPRKVLVVLQFGISVLLISSTLLVYQQLQYVKNRDLGYNPNNLITIPSSPGANKNIEVIRNELMNSNMVASLTRTSSPVTEIWNFTPAPDFKGKPDEKIIMTAMRTDVDFAKTIGARMLQGRDFMNTPGDSTVMLLNRAAVEKLQLKDPIGMEMNYHGNRFTVVGVTDNVVMGSPYAPVMPMIQMLDKERGGFFLLRLKNGVSPQKALPVFEKIFKKYNPENPFDYSFVDEQFSRKFITEDLIGRLTNLFAGLAIFICCLGLAGLTSFTIEKRFKEIGIRKVLGASVQQLLYLISKEFLLLVLLAALISIPVTWWILNNWLENYEYRINISIWLFLGSCAGVLLLTLVIVWMMSLRAAMANPVKNLRTE